MIRPPSIATAASRAWDANHQPRLTIRSRCSRSISWHLTPSGPAERAPEADVRPPARWCAGPSQGPHATKSREAFRRSARLVSRFASRERPAHPIQVAAAAAGASAPSCRSRCIAMATGRAVPSTGQREAFACQHAGSANASGCVRVMDGDKAGRDGQPGVSATDRRTGGIAGMPRRTGGIARMPR